MSEIKSENVYKQENSSQNTNHKNSKIDITPILKDVEQCIKSGLHDKLQSILVLFYVMFLS